MKDLPSLPGNPLPLAQRCGGRALWLLRWLPLPRAGFALIGGMLGYAGLHIYSWRRKIVRRNLELAYPHASVSWYRAQTRNVFMRLGRQVFDILWVSRLSLQRCKAIYRFEGLDLLRRYEDQPLLLLSAHLYAIPCAVRGLVLQRVIPGVTYKNAFIAMLGALQPDVLLLNLRSRTGLRNMSKTMQANGTVLLLPDISSIDRQHLPATFFGREVLYPAGWWRMLQKHQARVLYLACVYREGVYDVCIRDLPQESDQVIIRAAGQYTEQIVSAHPQQYWWFHRVFKGGDHTLYPAR